jgi:hypothetical protein
MQYCILGSKVQNAILHNLGLWGRMIYWRFMDYHLAGGTNVFMKWYHAQHPAVQAAFDFALKETAVTQKLEQGETFKTLTKAHLGLCEIKFSADDKSGTGTRQFRVLGFWNYNRVNFVLVGGGRKPIPETTFNDVMQKQLRFFRDGDGELYEHPL